MTDQNGEDGRPARGKEITRWAPYVSFALVALAAAAALRNGDIFGGDGPIIDRFFGTLMMVGVIGCALNGFRWRGNRLLRGIANPAFAWPAVIAGAGYGILS